MEIQTIKFKDLDSNDQAEAIVRVAGEAIGLSTFVVGGGECEVYMSIEDCKKLKDALSNAIAFLIVDKK